MLDSALRVDGLLLRMVNRPSHRWAVSEVAAARMAARRAQAVRCVRAAVGKARLQHKRPPGVGGEGLADRVDLLLHLGHRPGVHAALQDPHVPGEVLASVGAELRVGGGDGNLQVVRKRKEKGK